MHYLRKDATHWTDAETGQRVPAEVAAKLEAQWQSRDQRKADAAEIAHVTDALYRTDTPINDHSGAPRTGPAVGQRTPVTDASLGERAARAIAGDKLTPEQRKAVVAEIVKYAPDFVGNDKSDAYLVSRLEAHRASDSKAARLSGPVDAHEAERAERMKADSDPRADTMRSRDDALAAILNMHKTADAKGHAATDHDDEGSEPKNDVASILASMSRPVDRTRAATDHNDDAGGTPSFADIIADMSKPGER